MSPTGIYALVSFISFVAGVSLGKGIENLAGDFVPQRAKWIKRKAVVTKISSQLTTLGRGGRTYHPLWKYSYEGKQYTGTSSVGYGKEFHTTGQEIEILVNPLNPLESDLPYFFTIGKFEFDTFGTITKALLVFRVICFSICALSAAMLVFAIIQSGHL